MDSLRSLVAALLGLMAALAAPRAIYCIYRILSDDEQASLYKRRLKNLMTFTVIAACVLELLLLIYWRYLY